MNVKKYSGKSRLDNFENSLNNKNVTEMLILLRWVLSVVSNLYHFHVKNLFVRNIRSMEDDPINQATATDSR